MPLPPKCPEHGFVKVRECGRCFNAQKREIKRLQHFENMTKDKGWDNLRETAYHSGCEAGRAGAKKEIERLNVRLGKYKAELLEVYETSHSREASERLVREAVQRVEQALRRHESTETRMHSCEDCILAAEVRRLRAERGFVSGRPKPCPVCGAADGHERVFNAD